MKRGRQSGAELGVIVGLPSRKVPPPPPELTPSQGETWSTVMRSVPPNYIGKAAHAVVVELARHVDRGRTLQDLIANFRAEWVAEPGGLERLDKLLAAAEREGRAVLACCRSLRLTPSSVHPTTSARRLAEPGAGRRTPWDRKSAS
jgi:hypothetical protein